MITKVHNQDNFWKVAVKIFPLDNPISKQKYKHLIKINDFPLLNTFFFYYKYFSIKLVHSFSFSKFKRLRWILSFDIQL